MLRAIQDGHLGKIERTYTVEARNIYPILRWIGPALMVRVDSTDGTKEMLCFTGIEPVASQLVLAGNNSKAANVR
jgi:hypothetical protein